MMVPLVHKCIIPCGPMEGNTHLEVVKPWHLPAGTQCSVCGENLADIEEIVAALYKEALP